MGSGAPDSMWIREINTIKAERDKAIADREKISRILYEREEVGQRQIDELLRRLEYEKADKEMNEFPIRARWVKLSEREPGHDDEVFARKTAEDFLTVIYFAEEGDIKYSINGESYIFDDQMDQWEWLELRPKEDRSEPVIPLPDGRTLEINEKDDDFGTCLLLDGEKFIPIFHYNIKCEDIDSQCERYEKTILENRALNLCNKRLADKVKMLSGEKDQAVRKCQELDEILIEALVKYTGSDT